ncbi:MAG: hypothetical protein K5637_01945 [Lachnospiraceae bacterium]|nr:hypothetical protein [Lachnospiraceae bacterium]
MDDIAIAMGDSMVILDEDEGSVEIAGQTIYYREGVWCEKDEGGGVYAGLGADMVLH